MISFISGTVINRSSHSVIIQTTSGLGYEIHLTEVQAASYRVSEAVSLYTYLKVSENDLQLYGFRTGEEREFFLLLISVSGVGPKSAMNILALGPIDDIQSAIGRGDVTYLTRVSGIGKKTAERMVVELKSKIKEQGSKNKEQIDSGVLSEVIEGLVALGYLREEAREMVREIATEGKDVEEILRLALQRSSR